MIRHFETNSGVQVQASFMSATCALLIVLTMAGCETTPSRESEKVRILTTEAAKLEKCTHLVAVNSSRTEARGGMPSAHVDAKNKVASAGGNAFAITSQTKSADGTADIAGDAYSCPY
jgi:hypothetical protein